jgi:hypothetical protein
MGSEEISKLIQDGVTAGVKAALEAELKPFYVDRETHFKQHEFIAEMMKYAETCKSVVLGTVVRVIVYGVLGLLAIGFFIKYSGGKTP